METKETPIQAALRTGFIIGMIILVINFLIYFIEISLMASAWYGMFVIVLFFAMILFFGFQYRKSIGGYMEFGSAFQFAFVTLIISGLISIVGNILLYQVIDPGLPAVMADLQLENTLAMMDRFGAGDSISADAMDEMRNGLLANYSVAGQLKGFGFALIIYAILALILGAIIKKKDKSLDY